MHAPWRLLKEYRQIFCLPKPRALRDTSFHPFFVAPGPECLTRHVVAPPPVGAGLEDALELRAGAKAQRSGRLGRGSRRAGSERGETPGCAIPREIRAGGTRSLLCSLRQNGSARAGLRQAPGVRDARGRVPARHLARFLWGRTIASGRVCPGLSREHGGKVWGGPRAA